MLLGVIKERLRKNRGLVNILLVYFFLTFAIGYIDFDRRVCSFDASTALLQDVINGRMLPPMSHRILIPYTVFFFHKLTHIPLNYSYALFRFLFFFTAFGLFHLYLKKWFDDKMAMIGTLSLIAALPLTMTNWYCLPTDIPELIAFILGAWWIRDDRFRSLLVLIFIATFNKESTLALVLLYFLNGLGTKKLLPLLRNSFICFMVWFIPSVLLIKALGWRPWPSTFFNATKNLAGMLDVFRSFNPYNHYYFFIYLCGFYWVLAFCDLRKKDVFLRRSLLMIVPYFFYAFLRAGGIQEVRMFMPFCVFIIPLGLFSLFKGKEESLLTEK